jgi:hypothetical protein
MTLKRKVGKDMEGGGCSVFQYSTLQFTWRDWKNYYGNIYNSSRIYRHDNVFDL